MGERPAGPRSEPVIDPVDGLVIREVDGTRAADVLAVVHEAFGARPALDPPATALDETLASVHAALDAHGGLLAEHDGVPVGALLFELRGRMLGLRRVGVRARARGLGVAHRLSARAMQIAAERHFGGIELEARVELPATVAMWARYGFVEAGRNGNRITMLKLLPIERTLPTVEDTRAFGGWLATLLRPGDMVILTGDLGAGKTTMTQGLGDGLGVRGPVTSPTFVIARVHPSLVGGPPLIHVDAYRLGESAELDDLDLDTDVETAVTVVEWGRGLAEGLAHSRLELELTRADDDVRRLRLTPVGPRWRELVF